MPTKIAIIGTGGMAPYHCRKYRELDDCRIVAACDVDKERLALFAKEQDIADIYTQSDELLARSDCDAVAIVTPDPYHHPITLAALAAGKHVLCEKPLSLNYALAAEMRDAAARTGLVNMVHFTYRNSPAIQMATKLVAEGALGTVRHVHAHYLQSWLVQDAWGDWRVSPGWLWRLSKAHGSGGALGDLGIHLIDFASLPVGPVTSVHCRLQTFAKPEGETVGPYRLDANDSAIITATFANGALGTLHTTRWAYPHANSLRLNLYGDLASIEIDLDRSDSSLQISRNTARQPSAWETLECAPTPTIQERFVRAIQTGEPQQPDFSRGAEIQRILDACQESAIADRTINTNL